MKIKIKDFSINVKLSFILLIIIIIALDMMGQFFIVVVLAALHELCHIIAADIYGAKCREIIITPAGFCGVINMDNLSYFQKLVVLFSGPAFNIFFGLTFGSTASIVLGIFNLLPAYPLDGGKILNYTMGYVLGTLRANRYVLSVSMAVCFFMMALAILQTALFFGNMSLLMVSTFLLEVNKKQAQIFTYGYYKSLIHKANNRILKVRSVTVSKTTNLKTVIYRLGTDYYTVVYVRDKDIICRISEDRLQSFIINKGIGCTMEEVMKA